MTNIGCPWPTRRAPIRSSGKACISISTVQEHILATGRLASGRIEVGVEEARDRRCVVRLDTRDDASRAGLGERTCHPGVDRGGAEAPAARRGRDRDADLLRVVV